MIKYLFFILGSVVVENTAFFTTNTALELTAKNNPVLMRLLQTVDAATTDERLLDVSLQLLKSLCLCMRETLKTKQLESSLFSGDTNSLQAEDDTKDPSKKVLELYQNIYNKTCYDLKNEVASKVNKSTNISSDEEKDFMLRSDCGKTPIHDGTHIHEIQNQVTGNYKDDPRLEDILYQTFIKTRNYHRFRARKYSLYKATEKQIRFPAKHNIIVILTFYPSNDSSPSIINCTKLTDQLNNTLLTHSPIDIDIIDARFGQKENVSEESLMPKEATDCTLKSIYTFLLQSERNNKTKVFKLMRRSNTIKVYIDVTSGPNHSDYTKTCCSNRTGVSLCKIEFSNESFDSKEITTYPSTVDKSNNFKETISKIKSLVKLYDKKLKKKKLRRLTTQPSVKQNVVKNYSTTKDNTKGKFTKKREKGNMKMFKNPLKSVSTSTFLINDAVSKELWMNSIANDELSHEKYKIHNTDISLPISLVQKTTVPLEIWTEKDNQVQKEEATALHSKLFASSFILPNEASSKPLLSTEPLNVQDDQNNNVEQSLSKTSRYGLQMTGTSEFIHSKIGPTASYNITANRIIYNDSRQLTLNKHKSENINLSYGNKDIITTTVDLPLENTLEIVVTANDKQKKLTFDEFFAEPNLKMNHNLNKTSEITINNEENILKTSKNPFSKWPFFSICISLSKKTQHTELSSEKSTNNMTLSKDDTIAHDKVSQITYSNTIYVNNLTELRITPSTSNAGAQQDKIIEGSTSVTEPWGTNRTVSTVPTEKSNINNTTPSTSSKDNSINNNMNQLILKSNFVMHTETATLKSYDMIFHSIYDTQDGNRFTNYTASFESIKKANNDLKDSVKTTKSAKKDPYITLTVKEPTNYGHTSTVDTAYIDTIGKYSTTYSNRTEAEQNFAIINQSTEIFPYSLEESNESKNYKNSSELLKNKNNHLIDMLNVSRIMLDQQQNNIYSDAENEKEYSEALNSARTKGVSYPSVTDSKNSFEFATDLGDDEYKETEKLNYTIISGMDAYTMTEYMQTPTRNLRISLNQSKTTDEMKISNQNLDVKYLSTGYSETQNNTKLDKSKIEIQPKLYESNLNTLNATNSDVTDTVDFNTAKIYKDMDVKDVSKLNEYNESRFEPEMTKKVSIATLNSKAIDASDTSEIPENNFKNIEESNITTTDDILPEFEYSKLTGVDDFVTFPDFFENMSKKDEKIKDKRNKLIKKKVEENFYEPANHFDISEISTEKTRIKSEFEMDGGPSISNTLNEIKRTIINNSNPNITSELHPGLIELNDAKELLQDDYNAKESSYILAINKNMSVAGNQEKQLNKFKFSPSSSLTQNTLQDTTTYSLNHIEYTTDKTLVPSSSTLEILELFNTKKELAGITLPTDANFTVSGIKRDSENEIKLSALPEWPLSKIKSTILDVFDVNYSNYDDSKDYSYSTKPYVQNRTKNITNTIQRILVNDELSEPTRNNDMDPITRAPPSISDAKTKNASLIDEFSINPQVNEIFENIPYTTNLYSNSQGGDQKILHRDDNFSISKFSQDGILMSTVANTVTDSKTGVKKHTAVFDVISSYTSKSISREEHEDKSDYIKPTLTPEIFITNTKDKSKMPVIADSHMPETLYSTFDDVFNAQSNNHVVSKEISESTMSYLLNQKGNTAVFNDNMFTSNEEKILTTNVDQSSYGTQIDTLKDPLTGAMDINSQMYERFNNVSHTYPNSQSENNAVNSIKTNFNIVKPVTNVMPLIVIPTVNDLKTDAQNHYESENTIDTINLMAVNVFNTSFYNIDLSKEILDSTMPYMYNQNEETSKVVLQDNMDFIKKDTLTTISDAQGSLNPEVDAVKYPHSDAINTNSQVYEIFDSHTPNQDPSNQNADNTDTSIKTNRFMLKPSTDEIPMFEAPTVNDSKFEALNHHQSESTLNKINTTFVNVFNTSLNNIYLSKEILDSTKPYLYNRNEETSTVVLEDDIAFTKNDTITAISHAQGNIDPEADAVKYPHGDAIDINPQVNEIFENTSPSTNQDLSNEKADKTDRFITTNLSIIKPSMDEISIIVAPTVNDSKTEALDHHESESIPTFVNAFNTSLNNIDSSKEILNSTIPYLYMHPHEEISTVVLKNNIDFTKKDTITTISDAQDSIDLKVDAVKYPHNDAIDINSQVYEILGSTSPTTNQDPSNHKVDNTDTFIITNYSILKPNMDEISIIVAPAVNDSKTDALNHHASESILDTINSTFVNAFNASLNNIGLSKEILHSTVPYVYIQNEETSTVVFKNNIEFTKKDTITTISDAHGSIDLKVDAVKYPHSDALDITSQIYEIFDNTSHSTNQDLNPDNITDASIRINDNILKPNMDEISLIVAPTVSDSKFKTLNYHESKSTLNKINSMFDNIFNTSLNNIDLSKEILGSTIPYLYNQNEETSTLVPKDNINITKKDTVTTISNAQGSIDPEDETFKYTHSDAIDITSQVYEVHTTNQDPKNANKTVEGDFNNLKKNKNMIPIIVAPAGHSSKTKVQNYVDIFDNNSSLTTIPQGSVANNTENVYILHITDQINRDTRNENKINVIQESNLDTTTSAFVDTLNNASFTTNQYTNGQVENKTQDINRLLTATFDIPISNSRFQTETDVIMSSAVVRNDLNMNKNKITISHINDQSQGTTVDLFRDYTNNISSTEDKVSHVISIAKSENGPRLNTIKTSVYNVFNNTSYLYHVTKNISYTTKPSFNTHNMASSNTVDYLTVSDLNRVNTESSNTDVTHNDLLISSMICKTNKIIKKENQLNVPLIKTLGPFKSTFTDVLQSVSQSTKLFEDSNNETTATVFMNDGYVNSFKPMTNPEIVAEIVTDSKVNSSNTGLTEVFNVESEVDGLPDKIFFTTETSAQSQSYAKTDETYDPYRSDGLKSQEFNNIKNEISNITAPFNDLLLPSMLSKIKKIFRNDHKLNVSSEKMLKPKPTRTFEMHFNAYYNVSKDELLTTLIPLYNQNENENTTTVPHGNNDLYIFQTNTDRTPKMSVAQTDSYSMIQNLIHLHTNVSDTTASYTTEPYLRSQSGNKTDDILLTVAQLNVSKPNKFNTQSFGIIQSHIESELSNAIKNTPESVNNTIKSYNLSTNFTDPSTHYLHDQNEGTAVIEATNNSYNVPSINSDITFTTNIVEPNNLSTLDALKYSHTDIFDKNLSSKVLVTTNSYTSTYISTNDDISTFTTPPIYEVTTRSSDVSKTFNKSVNSDAVGPITELDLISKSSSENLVPLYTKVFHVMSSQPHEFTQNMSHVTKRYLENIDRDIPYDIKVPVTYDSSSAEAYYTSRISNRTSTSKSAVSNVTLQNIIVFTSTMMDEMQVATDNISNESLDLTRLINFTQDIPPSNDSLLASIIKTFKNSPTSYTNKSNAWPAKNFTEKSDIKPYSYGINRNSTDAKQVEVAAYDRTGPNNYSVVFRMLNKDQESMNKDTEADYISTERYRFQSIHAENDSLSYLQNLNGYFTSKHHNISNINQYPSMTPMTTSFPITRNIKYYTELNHSTLNNDIAVLPLFKEYSSNIRLDDTNPYSTNANIKYTDVMKIVAKVTKSPSMIASIPPTYDYLIVSNMVEDTNDMIKNDDPLNKFETKTKKILTGDLSEHISSHTGTPPIFQDQEKSLNLSREHKLSKINKPREALNTNNLIIDVPKITNNYDDTTEYVIYDALFTPKNNIQETEKNNGSYITNENTGGDHNTPILATPNIQFVSNFVELMKSDGFGGEQEILDNTENRATNSNEHYIYTIQTPAYIGKSQQIFADTTQTSNSLVVSNIVGKGKETIQDDLTVNAMAVSTTESDKPLLADVSYDQTFLGTSPYYSDENENSTEDSEGQITTKITTYKDDILKMQTTNAIKVVSNKFKKVMVKNDIDMNIWPTKSNDTYKHSVISDNSYNLSRGTIPYSLNQQKDKTNYLKDELNISSGLEASIEVSARSKQLKKQVTRFTIPNPRPSAGNINEDRKTKTVTEKITLTTKALDLNLTKLFSSVNNILDTIKSPTAKESDQYNPIELGVDMKYRNGVTSSDNNNMLSHYLTEAHTNNAKHSKVSNKTGKTAYLVTVSSKEINNVSINYENHATTNIPFKQNLIKEYFVEPGITKTNIDLDSEKEIELDDIINTKPLNITVFKNKTATDSVTNPQYMDQVNFIESAITTSSFRELQQTSYTTMVQENTTINDINFTSPTREDNFLVPKMSPVTVAKMITEVPHLIGKQLLDKNAFRLPDTIGTLPLNETVESNNATNDFYIYNFDINSSTVENTFKPINKFKYGSNISPYNNTNVDIDLITAREPKITNSYIEQSDNKLNNKNSTKTPLNTENIDQETRRSVVIPINIKLNMNNSNITRVHNLKYQNLTTLVVPTTLKIRNKNIVHKLVNSASIITNNFGIKQENRDIDDTKTIFIINRSTYHSTSANPLKKIKAEASFDTYVNKNDTNIKPETGNNASFSLFNGTDKAYTMFLNPETHLLDNTHSKRSFISKAKHLESLAEGSDKNNVKKVEKNTSINLNVTSKPNIKTSKSIVYNTYKALTEEELTLPPDVRKIITTFSTIYTKEMNSSNQIAKLKTRKTDIKQIQTDFQSKLAVGNNTKKIKKPKLINVMKENVSVDAFINDTLQLNHRTYLHPIEKLPIQIQRKSLKRIKLKNRKSIMAMNTNDFLSFRRAATIRDSLHEILKEHPMSVLKQQMKASTIAKVPRRLILRPMFNSFEDFKKNPVVKPFIPKHIIMPDDNDFYRSSFQKHHKYIQPWKEKIGDVRSQLGPQRRSGPIALAQKKDYESVIDVPYYMPTLMKPYFLRDKVESVRSYIYNEEKNPVNARKHFRSPPRVETSGAVVDAPDSQEHVYYSAGASREDVTELSSPRVTRPKKTIFFLSPTIPYNRYF